MTICIYSPILELAEVIAENIEETGEVCFKFSNSSSLAEFLTSIKHLPDLLILDYTCYNHEFFNIQPTLKSINKLFPVIFYNDPCLIHPKRSLHWETQLKLMYNITEKEQLEKYKQIFEKIETIVESPELKRYIPLMQTPLPFPKNESKTKTLFSKLQIDTSLSLLNFKKRCNLAENLYYLLLLFYNNRETPLSIEEIIELYKKDKKQITEQSLRVSISRLKSKIAEDKENSFFIHKQNNKYKIEFF